MRPSEYIIRASIATLAKLGIIDLGINIPMKTMYLLQYSRNGCLAGCRFCSQSFTNMADKRFLSRISWPVISLNNLIEHIRKNGSWIKRICLQSVMKKGFIDEIIDIVKLFRRSNIDVPMSVAINPVSVKYLYELKDLGVDSIGIGLDAISPKVFMKVGKPYTWNVYMEFIRKSLHVFGKNHVFVHLIIGLGESFHETIDLIHKLIKMGAGIALFSYTPLKGVKLHNIRPDIGYYRAVQILTYYLSKGYEPLDIVYVENERIYIRKEIVQEILEDINKYLEIFLTRGCPHCNRPYYNESPRGPFYNFYSVDHVKRYVNVLKQELLRLMGDR